MVLCGQKQRYGYSIGDREGIGMLHLCFPYNEVSLLDMSYLLSNYDGYLDADKRCMVVDI